MNVILMTILGCTLPGLATGVGALPIFFAQRVSQRVLDTLLGGAAGVMLAATCFRLFCQASHTVVAILRR